MDNNLKYLVISDEEILEEIQKINLLFTEFVNKYHGNRLVKVRQADCSIQGLKECVIRVHQREVYFNIFHNTPDGLHEIKKFSLYCYWFIKHRPFSFDVEVLNQNINRNELEKANEIKFYFLERFCLWVYHRIAKSIIPNYKPLKAEKLHKIAYSLKNHDISKEFLTTLFEVITSQS